MKRTLATALLLAALTACGRESKPDPAYRDQWRPAFERALESPDWTVRRNAAASLGRLGLESEPALRRALEDPHPKVAEAAAEALTRVAARRPIMPELR